MMIDEGMDRCTRHLVDEYDSMLECFHVKLGGYLAVVDGMFTLCSCRRHLGDVLCRMERYGSAYRKVCILCRVLAMEE